MFLHFNKNIKNVFYIYMYVANLDVTATVVTAATTLRQIEELALAVP